MKFITISLLAFVVFFNTTLSAQTLGEYRSKQSGNWDDPNTWEQWDGTAWVTQYQGGTAVTPVVEATNTGVQNPNATSHSVNLPSGIVAGELLLVVFSTDGNPTITINTGVSGNNWVKLGQTNQADVVGSIFWKIAEGSDVLTLTTSASETSSHISYRISGGASFSVYSASDVGTTAANTSNPPSLTADPGNAPYLWIATASKDGDNQIATGAPTDFTNLLTQASVGGGSTSTAIRSFTATNQDPSNFTGFPATDQWVSYTLAVYSTNPVFDPISYPQYVFPTVAGTRTGALYENATSHPIDLPLNITAGEMLVVVFSVDGDPDVTVNTGISGNNWTKLGQAINGTAVVGAIFWKIAEGNDVLTLTTSNTQRNSYISYRIRDAISISGTSANGSSTDSNPPNHVAPNGTNNYLWIATRSGDDLVVATAAPTNYSNMFTIGSGAGGSGGATTNTAIRSLNAASEDPGTFTSASEQWVSYTLAIQPRAVKVTILDTHVVTANVNAGANETTINAGGKLVVNNGITYTVPANGTFTHAVGSIIGGTGTLDFSGNTFTNAGTVAPGFSPGKLNIDDNFVNNGILNIEITGAPAGGAGVAFDQLDVNGSATINGTINIDFGVYVPTAGSKYQIVLSQTNAYSGNPIIIVVNNVVPVTYSNGVLTTYAATYEKVWDGEANTNAWEDANNWYPNGVPAAGQDVLIALDANVVLSSNPTIKSLIIGLFETADTLTIAQSYTLTTTGNGPIGNDGVHLNENFGNVLIVEGSLMISGVTGDGIDVNPMTSLTITSTGSATISSPGNDGIEIGDDFSNSGIIIINTPGQSGLNVQTGAAGSTIENNSTGSITVLGSGAVGYGISLGTGTALTNDGTIILTTNSVNITNGSGDLTNNGTFKGKGNIDGNDFFSGSGSTIAPGTSPGILTFTNSSSMNLSNNVIFDFEINGKTTPGVDYDQIVVSGPSVNITNGTLNLSGTYTPAPGDIFTLFNVSGGNVIGTFNGLPEGSEIIFNGKSLTISYVGGNIRLSAQAPLPVELISFNAQAMEREVKLSWSTASEINNDYFTLERSTDGRTFETIATILGHGTTTEISNYIHMDKNPVSGLNYYRLKQTDFDGKFSYSDVKSVDFRSGETVKVYPTVVSGVVTVEAENGFDGDLTIDIRDLTGKAYKTIFISSGSNKLEASLNDLTPGIYFVVVTTSTTTVTQKIIKQ